MVAGVAAAGLDSWGRRLSARRPASIFRLLGLCVAQASDDYDEQYLDLRESPVGLDSGGRIGILLELKRACPEEVSGWVCSTEGNQRGMSGTQGSPLLWNS